MINEVGVYNPLPYDFECRYDGKALRVPSRDITYFDDKIAVHVKKHLYTAIVRHRNLNGIALNANPKLKQDILDEMEVNFDVEAN